jgi:hypothetical protein
MTHRRLKKEALALLRSGNLDSALESLCTFPPRQIVNPLFGLLYHGDPLVRWRAVSAMGAVVSQMARKEIESARIVMRRFMWNLNDESGGIGWGSPESLGEIMARNAQLAREYGCILISYADPEGNYLEHPTLQQGVLWAWGRLGHERPEMVRPAACLLKPYLLSSDPQLQGLAAWAAAPLGDRTLEEALNTLVGSRKEITLYVAHEFKTHSIGGLARWALGKNHPYKETGP